MLHIAHVKNFVMIAPAALATAATATNAILDTSGFRSALITVAFNAASATNSNATLASISLQESDQSSATSSFTTISGGGGLTAASGTSFAIGVNNQTSSGAVLQYAVDLRGRKRYLQLIATNGTAANVTHIAAVASLSRAEQVPNSATEAGANVNRVIL